MIAYTESNFYMQQWQSRWVMSICYSWEHSWNEIITCRLNWELSTFWKRQLIGCSRSFCQSEQSDFPPLSLRMSPLYWPISWQQIRTRFLQSAVPNRCAVLFSVINISNSQAPGSSSWVNLTVWSVAYGGSLNTPASLSQAKYAQKHNPITILSLMPV